ncbi:hypothetical protein DPMN_029577 [Dreissena polymorpha]|uniref:Uncharacterized protein n=1 Tax=Dreissena polymorpha TaxID=45954 RepID=A0A9D4LZE2_DREPO|nr:hypothetical protein DPMN_029577 [Dreissena polymorpha]
MSLCLSEFPARLIVSVANYFLVVWVTVPASWICSSAETLSVSISLVLAVLNYSTSENSAGCSLLLFGTVLR